MYKTKNVQKWLGMFRHVFMDLYCCTKNYPCALANVQVAELSKHEYKAQHK